jgi:hypothetical protein
MRHVLNYRAHTQIFESIFTMEKVRNLGMTTPRAAQTDLINVEMDKFELDHDLYRIALYYCYIPVEKVDRFIERQEHLCSSNNLKGRIRVASEGLNGVLSGLTVHIEAYVESLLDELSISSFID